MYTEKKKHFGTAGLSRIFHVFNLYILMQILPFETGVTQKTCFGLKSILLDFMQNLDTSGAKIIPTPVRINETAQEKCKDNAEPGHRVKTQE